ncbi:Transcription factor mst12 [Sporothrix bragantina]|uniref:Transcription factor mst12 n=1 Tax=Sporothrix bragantina TaxID=671064 RepID=A0ABP0BG74_9PEZI
MLSTEAQQALPHDAQVALQQVDNLKYFLISAPVDWPPEHYIRRFLLPTGEYVSCVLWNGLFHISGTDIVRCLSFRFQAFGRPVKNSKKFEEGIFSDLRNLKSGTDASLEEPKSPFLDFLYKNNCIRTQKKQKVFYWYSVPHDRLFLDALERDLKREKMGQEATTVAVSEPALSFQYDSSQSLYDQLTKAQQANSSSFSAQQVAFPQSQTASPVIRAMDSMPPPQMPQMTQMIPQSMAPLADGMDAIVPFTTAAAMQMAPPLAQQVVKREADFARVQYNQNGVPVAAGHQRHASMPAYALEYSPAPSFVSSQYDDYGNRGISFEPLTPPQLATGITSEPAYIANEETGLYTAIPDHLNAGMNGLNGMVQLPPSNLAGPQFSRGYSNNNVYSPVIEGSPTYKQRRRRSSIPPGMSAIVAATAATAAAVHRPSDLRRSVSVSVGPVAEGDESLDNSPPGLTYSNSAISLTSQQHKELLDLSRHGTPLSTVEGSPGLNPMALQHPQEYPQMTSDELPVANGGVSMGEEPRRPMPNGGANVIRRARSATVMELGPYPQKSHSCPIPTCGRLFKRLEHLKRHKRTHDRSDGGDGTFPLSGEEEEEYSGEDQLGSVEEASPTSEGGYVTASLNSVVNSGLTPTSAAHAVNAFNSLQTLSMPMTISQPQAINTGSMM